MVTSSAERAKNMLAVVDELKRARDQMDMGMANRLCSAPCAAMTFCSKMGMQNQSYRLPRSHAEMNTR
jgi:hypothetical protein